MPIRLPEAPHQYSRSDQDMLRRLIEQAVNATPAGGGVAPTPSLPVGAAYDTLYYDGTNWTNSAILRNTGTLNGGVTAGSSNVYGYFGTGTYIHARREPAAGATAWVLQLTSDDVNFWPYYLALGEGAVGGAEFSAHYFGASGTPYFTFGNFGGTRAAPDYAAAGAALGSIGWYGWKGSGTYPDIWHESAAMNAIVDATWSGTSRPSRIEFYTTSVNSLAKALRLTIGSDGFLTHGFTDRVILGPITAAAQVRDDTVTWNAAVVFTGWKLNVTATTYSVGSKLLDIQVSNTSRFFVKLDTGEGAFVQITPPDNHAGLQVAGSLTGSNSNTRVYIAPSLNTTGHPNILYVNAINAGGFGTSTQLIRAAVDGGTLFSVLATGQVGLCGGATADAWVRILSGSASNVEEGLQVNTTLTNATGLSHWVVNILGGGQAGSAYTTPVVQSLAIGTYVKATNQTITTWYGIDILAGPTAGTKWSIRTAESVWIKGNLVVDGTITGFSGIGSHTHAETDITDGSLLARVAANETISGTWTFDSPVTVGLGGSTSSLQPGGAVSAQFDVVGNVGSGEDNLMTYTLPADAFNTGNRVIRVKAWGTLAANSNAKTVRFYFGSTSFLFINAVTDTTYNGWAAEFYIIRRTTDSQEVMGETRIVTTALVYAFVQEWAGFGSAQDDAAAITIKFTGEATANNDITQEGMIVEFLN